MPTSYDLGTASGKVVIDYDGKGVTAAGTGLETLGKHANNLGSTLGATQRSLNLVGTTALAAGAVVAGGFAFAVNAAVGFEKQMSAIQAVSGATADQMGLISKASLRIGKDTAFSAKQAGMAFEELVKAGISVEDALNGAADATVALAAAGGIDLPTAANLAAQAMNAFGLGAKDLVSVTNDVAGAANASAIDVGQFAQSLSQVGAVAHLAGLNFFDTAVAIAEMGNAGIVGSDAGTSLKQVLLNLIPVGKKQIQVAKDLGIITADGTNQFFTQAGAVKDLRGIQEVLQKSTANLTAEQKISALGILFGSDAIRGATVLANAGAAGYDSLSESMSKISAADVAATRMNNLAGQTEQLKGSVETLGIMIGSLLIPAVLKIVTGFLDFTNKIIGLSDAQLKLVAGIAGFIGVGLLLVGVIAKLAAGALIFRQAILEATGAQTLFTAVQGRAAAVTVIQAAAQRGLNAALKASPIILIVALIAGLIAAYVHLYKTNKDIQKIFNDAWTTLSDAIKPLLPTLAEVSKGFSSVLSSGLKALVPVLVSLAQAVIPPLVGMLVSLAPVLKQIGDIVGSVLTVAFKILEPILGIVIGVLGLLYKVLSPILGVVIDLITKGLDLLAPVLKIVADALAIGAQAVSDWINSFSGDSKQALADFGADAVKWFVQVALPAMQTFLDGATVIVGYIVNDLVPAMVGGWQTMSDGVTTAIDIIGSVFGIVFAPIIAAFNFFTTVIIPLFVAGMTLIQQVAQPVIDVFNAFNAAIMGFITPIVDAILNNLVPVFTTSFEAISSVVNNVVDLFVNYVGPLISAVVDLMAKLFGFFAAVVAVAWAGISSTITGAVGSIVSFVTPAFNGLVGFFKTVFGPVADFLKKPFADFLNFIGTIGGTIISMFSGAGQWLINAGRDIINGLINGIKNALGGLTGLLNGITKMIPEKKGPPEKDKTLLTKNGGYIMQGFIAGIKEQLPELYSVLGGITADMPDSIKATVNAAGSTVANESKTFVYNAAPGSGQLSGEQEFFSAIKKSKVVVPGW